MNQVKMLKACLKIITTLSILLINCNAQSYECEINAVKDLIMNSVKLIDKTKRLKVILDRHSDYIDMKVNNSIARLNYAKSGKIMCYLNADVYANNIEQLEIIDLEQSYSSGARYFYKDKMYLIGNCK